MVSHRRKHRLPKIGLMLYDDKSFEGAVIAVEPLHHGGCDIYVFKHGFCKYE